MMNIIGKTTSEKIKCKTVLDHLLTSIKECQTVYGKTKTLLATEKDVRIVNLCKNWELALSHGLKTTSVFKSIVTGNLTAVTESQTTTFWDFAVTHLTAHEKERFSTLRIVYTDQGRVRALIRAALNERSLERYVLTWLGDAKGLEARFEPWALLRDTEASNLLPSMAAGLATILFAVTVDASELNVLPVQETKLARKINEIIIAVPKASCGSVDSTESGSSRERKRNKIISFDEDESENLPDLMMTKAHVSLADACLKYEEKEKQLINGSSSGFLSDSAYERNLQRSGSIASSGRTSPNETDYVEPESPSTIQIYNPVLRTKSYPSYSEFTFDLERNDSNISKILDSASSVTSTTSMSTAPPIVTRSESMQSSVSSIHQTIPTSESAQVHDESQIRIHDLEDRCANLEEQVKILTLENARLKSLHHNLVASRQTSKYFSISVPRVLLQRSVNSRRKKYFAYEIQIVPLNGRGDDERWAVLRRYSEFHRLHKYLQKDNVAIKTFDFPPKKSFGNMNAEFVEQRRQRLQVYLLSVLSLMPEISRCTSRFQLEQVFPFFKQSHQI